MFKKQPKTDAKRTRQPIIPDRNNTSRSVFSYHANRSARSASDPPRTASTMPWTNAPKSSPQNAPKTLLKRIRIGLTIAAVAGLGIYSLILDRTAEVVALTDGDNRQVFLRKQDVYEQAVRARMASSWTNSNKLTIDTKRIAEDLRKQFPELEHASVVLPAFGRRPVIYIQPARPALLLKTSDGGVFVLDAAGRALIGASQVPKVEKLGLTVVEDQSSLPASLGRTALPSTNVAFIAEVAGQLKSKKLAVTGMVLPRGTSQLDVQISGVPYIVKFNLHGDARAEVGAYLAVKKHLEQEKKAPSSYVDVRVNNRVYYR